MTGPCIRVPKTKRSNIPEETWQNAISDNRALIVVHRNQINPCSENITVTYQ
ncbi:20744_t:CDS:2 [Rhizophagus irregularis]|nr:20744_t:CDS:2 [Rhizophagus irregularis]